MIVADLYGDAEQSRLARVQRWLNGPGDHVEALRRGEATLAQLQSWAEKARADGWLGYARGLEAAASMLRGDLAALVEVGLELEDRQGGGIVAAPATVHGVAGHPEG